MFCSGSLATSKVSKKNLEYSFHVDYRHYDPTLFFLISSHPTGHWPTLPVGQSIKTKISTIYHRWEIWYITLFLNSENLEFNSCLLQDAIARQNTNWSSESETSLAWVRNIYLKQNNFLSDIEESYGKKSNLACSWNVQKTSKTSKAKVLYYYTCNCL